MHPRAVRVRGYFSPPATKKRSKNRRPGEPLVLTGGDSPSLFWGQQGAGRGLWNLRPEGPSPSGSILILAHFEDLTMLYRYSIL